MNPQLKVVVLGGGDSPEREISLASSKEVFESVMQCGYEVTLLDPKHKTKDYEETIRQAAVVLPIMHGLGGEDGSIQSYLEQIDVAYLGTTSAASQNSFSKHTSHQVLAQHDILMPRYKIIDLSTISDVDALLGTDFVLKPIEGGSSIDTIIATNATLDDIRYAKELVSKHTQMLYEERVEGTEITVGVLDDDVLPIVTIIPPENKVFDFENKYNGSTAELCPTPENILSLEIQAKAQRIAKSVHAALQARHLSRVDMIVTEAGDIYVLELNTMPGMTRQSLYPKAAAAVGYTMPQLVDKLIRIAIGE